MGAVLPISELADLVHRHDNPWKAMALLRVFLDESGTHGDSKITAIGGLLGTKDTWQSVENQWLAALDVLADVGVTWYRSSDCDGGFGQFENIPIEVRFALANSLARVLADHKLLPVWAAVVNEDWDKTVTDPNFLRSFPKPLHLCFSHCAQRLAEGSAKLAGGSSVGVVYAEQPEFEDSFKDAWDAYRRNKRTARLSSFSTASSKDCPSLQAADLIAYEMNRDWREREYGAPPPPLTTRMRKPLHFLRERLRLDFGGCYDASALRETMRRFKDSGDI